jgi:DNA polymerase III alpha subunit (gram-positive type)
MLYTVYDIETTGLSPHTNDIIQFAYITVKPSMEIHSSGNLYFYKDGMDWSRQAEAVHHIPQSFLRQYSDQFDENVRKMYVITQRGNLVGHNIDQFDLPFCIKFAERNGMPSITPLRTHDTMRLYPPRKKLGVLAEKLEISPIVIDSVTEGLFGDAGQAHDARRDAVTTMLIFAHAKREGLISDV